ncbi:MAG: hypothetical protein A2622_04380 [Bdellovibrionales bacterium RIFCSPHIGHO2_01_FULL_40_29]|nr:MAG: hypothetical protein A2622_04380 [Bdellovibrionales bacterium RIFCSPHIGHO2_01_FULL_40_29]OFZ34825.1 MAG: hypothetical protein A3D17_10995 [Bdellovibrionales bacterium RIFCSPHIGHO2_02_FULL_40_15]
MPDGNSIIDIGKLAEPAKVLIEKISDAVGWVAKPYQIKRIASAEAEAEKIKAIAQIEVTEIQNRGLVRMIQIEGKKQENIEQITSKAFADLNPDAKPNEVDNEWIANFFEKCDTVSDAEMQSLWAKILAGESNKPGAFSKRTVNNISSLDKSEAHLFTTLCRFGWAIGTFTPLIYNIEDDIYKQNGISFSTLTHLESIGLITFNNLQGFIRRQLPQKFLITYYGTQVIVELPQNVSEMKIGNILLTKMGQELAPICGSQPIIGFVEYVKEYWKKENYMVKGTV